MALFKITGSNVKKIGPKDLDLEKHLQALFESNLEELLNITFLAHEYPTSFGGRIDTLGIDKNGSPCIIEYKRGQNDNVINQGLSYLRWLLDHKADFEILCYGTLPERSRELKNNVDWDSPRVICIAESYNKFDLDTADILPIKIELLRYRLYNENLLHLEPEGQQKIHISTNRIIKKGKIKKNKGLQLQKNYSVKEHLNGIPKEIITLFEALREQIMSLDDTVREEPMKFYIAYKLATNFVDVVIHKNELKIFLNVKSGELIDLKGLARDLEKPKRIGHHGNGDYEIRLGKLEGLSAVFALVKQSYDLNK